MNASSDELQNQYICDLKKHVERYLSILESIFGQRDSRFVFGTIRESDMRPRTYFPKGFHFNGRCRVDILITKEPWAHRSPDQGPWQIAHECVHLLDPNKADTVNILEEGLASWFQDEPRHHDELIQRYIAENGDRLQAYLEARCLVRRSLPDLLHAVKTLRASGARIGEIDAGMLAPLLPNTETWIVERLCARFRD